jgi:hypothetical protein
VIADDVTQAIAAIGEPSEFALALACPARDLVVSVKGVGRIRFPVSPRQARLVIAAGRLAWFGLGAKTLKDTRVRNTFEVARSALRIDAPRFRRALGTHLEAIKQRLGLDPSGTLEAELDKLLVYGPGQFFRQHQDSERSDDMVASLLVVLPSPHTGGEVVVSHHGETKTFRPSGRAAKRLSLLAFYADCRHEVKPVVSGYRLALTYRLRHTPAAPAAETFRLRPGAAARLRRSVERYFATPRPRPEWSAEPPARPDRLVYLLDHEYTQRSLGWGRLKQQDRARAAALRSAGAELGCEVHLAIAEVHDSWSCEGDDSDRGWALRDRSEAGGDDPDDDAGDHELIELQSTEVVLRHWLDADGKPSRDLAPSPIADDDVCFTRQSVELNPFRSEHEGYMGNYGNTVDRWYHRAAVVLWPGERAFTVRSAIAPAWAVGEVLALARKGAVDEAQARARSLLPSWARSAGADTRAGFVARVLRTAIAIEDPGIAMDLLAPLGLERLGPAGLRLLPALVERHGVDRCEQLFAAWTGQRLKRTWPGRLPDVARALAAGGAAGRELGLRLVDRATARLRDELARERGGPVSRLGRIRFQELAADLLSLLEGAVALASETHRDAIVATLEPLDPALHLPLLGAILIAAESGRDAARLRALGLGPVRVRVEAELARVLALPERGRDDWSIAPPRDCGCELCAEIDAFLADPARAALDCKIAAQSRRHVHMRIEAHDLPVSHATRRRGSPFTLELVKLDRLFAASAAERREQAALLARLRRRRPASAAAPPGRRARARLEPGRRGR